jgi:hypothetical protein
MYVVFDVELAMTCQTTLFCQILVPLFSPYIFGYKISGSRTDFLLLQNLLYGQT